MRYADDFIVMARYQGDRLTGWNLMNLGLEPLQSKGTRMLEIKRMQESRVMENCTHGLTRGAEETPLLLYRFLRLTQLRFPS